MGDSSELWSTLELKCSPRKGDGKYPQCQGSDLALFHGLRQQHLNAWDAFIQRSGNGAWTVACIEHTLTWGHWTDTAWEVPAGSGMTISRAVAQWLSGNSTGSNVHEDTVGWPGNTPCAKADLSAAHSDHANPL